MRRSIGSRCLLPGVLSLFLCLSQSAGLSGQATEEDPLPWPVAGAGSRIGPIAGELRAVVGGWLAVGLSPSTSLGGGGFALSRLVEVRTSPLSDLELDFGYAGLLVEHLRPIWQDTSLAGRILAGAGHASVRPAGSASEIGADNFAVLEGGLELRWSPIQRLEFGAGLGYRVAGGVDDLEGVEWDDLSGPLVSLSINVTGR